MIDYSEAVWITPKRVIGIKCSYCGKTINRSVVKSILDRTSDLFCNRACAVKFRETQPSQEYDLDFSDKYYQPVSPEVCQKHFGITNCLECTLPECKEVIIDNSGSKNYTGIILDLKKQLCY